MRGQVGLPTVQPTELEQTQRAMQEPDNWMFCDLNLASESSYLNKMSVFGLLIFLVLDLVMVLPWTVFASVIWRTRALFTWIMAAPFFLRWIMILWALIEVKKPFRVDTFKVGINVGEEEEMDHVRKFGVVTPYNSLLNLGLLAKYLHPLLMLVVVIVSLCVLPVFGSVVVTVVNFIWFLLVTLEGNVYYELMRKVFFRGARLVAIKRIIANGAPVQHGCLAERLK